MTLMAQMECCTTLGISPKTLRNWLRQAKMQFVPHPSDARLNCLTTEQVQQLATLHARALQLAPDPSRGLPEEVTPLASSPGDLAAPEANGASPVSLTTSSSEEVELRKAVCSLEAKVLTLQEQLTQLALELLCERTQRYEQRLSALEALLSPHAARSPSTQEVAPVVDQGQERPSPSPRALQPAELRARSRVLARIEYPTGCATSCEQANSNMRRTYC